MRWFGWALVAACAIEEGEVCIQAGGEQSTCPAAAEVDPEDAFLSGGGDCDAKVARIVERLNERPELPVGSDGFGTRCCYVAKLRDPSPFSECSPLSDAL